MRLTRIFASLALVVGLSVALGTTALAANLDHDGTDPNSTGCSGSASAAPCRGEQEGWASIPIVAAAWLVPSLGLLSG